MATVPRFVLGLGKKIELGGIYIVHYFMFDCDTHTRTLWRTGLGFVPEDRRFGACDYSGDVSIK